MPRRSLVRRRPWSWGASDWTRRSISPGSFSIRSSGSRHEKVLREAIEDVLRNSRARRHPQNCPPPRLVPERHLGLVVPDEYPDREALRGSLEELVEARVDFEKLWSLACAAPNSMHPPSSARACPTVRGSRSAISATPLSPFTIRRTWTSLSGCRRRVGSDFGARLGLVAGRSDALYMGGGFPETHGEALAANRTFLASLRRAAERGLPIYAECGGLMLLSQAILWQGRRHPMAGVLPFEVQVCARPQGHGYTELCVDAENAFFPLGSVLRGHEFHYSANSCREPACPVPPARCGAASAAAAGVTGWWLGTCGPATRTCTRWPLPSGQQGLLNAARRLRRGRVCASPS